MCCRPFVLSQVEAHEGSTTLSPALGDASNYPSPFDKFRANVSLRLLTALFRFIGFDGINHPHQVFAKNDAHLGPNV